VAHRGTLRNTKGTLKDRAMIYKSAMNKAFTEKLKVSVPKFKIVSKQ
jgi:hypothetical protein